MRAFRPAATQVRRPVAATAKTAVQPVRALRSPLVSKRGNNLFTTATLQRGRIYFFHNVPFERSVEVAIDQDLCDKYAVGLSPEDFVLELTDLYEEVTDSDQERFAKPIFEVRHNRPRPLTEVEREAAERPRRIRQFVDIGERGPELVRPAPTSRRSVGLTRR